MKILKKIIAASVFALASICANAIPGITPQIPDSSGEFVYWRDNSFERESYIGMIYYDDSTYGIRYYAPAFQKKPALSFLILFTINPEKTGAVELTGEKVEPFPRSEEETSIINYLHDFVYETFPRRENAGKITKRKKVSDDFAQFGGKVSFEYDPLIPVLNLRSIMPSDGKNGLNLVTIGKLRGNNDTSFSSFSGIPNKAKTQKLKMNKKLAKEKTDIAEELFSFQIDSQWEQKSPTNWMLGDAAMITAAQGNFPEGIENRLLRMMTLGVDKSYPDFSSVSIKKTEGETRISQKIYDSETEHFQLDKKIVKKLSDGSTVIFSLTVEESVYKKNKEYFDSIFNSFKTKD